MRVLIFSSYIYLYLANIYIYMPGSPHQQWSLESVSSFDRILGKAGVNLAVVYGHKHTH